jgi:hypothetical protein
MTEPVELSGFDDLDAMKSGTNVEIDLGFEEL